MRVILFIAGLGVLAHVMRPDSDPPRAPSASPPAVKARVAPPPAFDETVLLRDASGHFYADAHVNYGRVRFMVDTGASTIALSEADARGVGIVIDPSRWTVVGRGASGDVIGQSVTIDSVSVSGKRATGLSGVVLRDSGVSLLGQSFLQRLESVKIAGDRMVLK